MQMSNSAASDLEKCSDGKPQLATFYFIATQISSCFVRFLQTNKHYLGILESSE